MAQLNVSETQFVFTYFHHFLNLPQKKTIRFVLPSLLQEGDPNSPYAGADLIIFGHIYIQFKMSDYLDWDSAREISAGKVDNSYKPYFRYNIKNASTV